jgi:membrane-bound inhibitor of C-type lysozyme
MISQSVGACPSRAMSRVRATAACVMLASACLITGAIADEPISEVKYACADAKTIEATYYPEKVDLVLSDGRTMTLPQTMSGSGIRYANADETFVFWSKGNTAFATESDPNTPTFADCVEQPKS